MMDKFKQMTFNGLEAQDEKRQFSFKLTLTLDRMFIYSILVLIIVVLIFSLGVEQGKKIAAQKLENAILQNAAMPAVPPQPEVALSVTSVTPAAPVEKKDTAVGSPAVGAVKPAALVLPASVKEEPEKIKQPPVKETLVQAQAPSAQKTPAPKVETDLKKTSAKKAFYYIQVVSYSSDRDAQQEVQKLKTEGFEATINVRGKYRAVVVGNFATKAEADKTLSALKKIRKDAFIRRKEL